MEEKRSFTVLIIVGLLLLLPCLYVGTYYMTVSQVFDEVYSTDNGVYWYPKYPVENPVIFEAFYPVHCIDRWVRHDHWTTGLSLNEKAPPD